MDFYQKKDLYISKAREFFPDFDFSSSFSLYSGELEAPSSARVSVKTKSFNHREIGLKNIELAHYTSVDSFINIINSKSVRMYNCDNLNDTKELIFAVKKYELPMSDVEISDFRRQHFVLSTCKLDEGLKEDFNMWRLYGHNGRGVCIHFETDVEFPNWTGLIGNEMNYNDDLDSSRLSEFFKFHLSFQKEHKIFQNTPNFIPILLLFNKEKIWSIEKEFRILANCPFNKYSSKVGSIIGNSYSPWLTNTLKHSVNSSGNLVSYLELPIEIYHKANENGEEVNLVDRSPRLRIKRIVLGYDIPEKMRDNIVAFLIRRKAPYQIQVVNSEFSTQTSSL